MPSAQILRQRFQGLSLETQIEDKLPECSVTMWQETNKELVPI
jgi:hypothetical protein